jgi:hypothetical protein
MLEVLRLGLRGLVFDRGDGAGVGLVRWKTSPTTHPGDDLIAEEERDAQAAGNRNVDQHRVSRRVAAADRATQDQIHGALLRAVEVVVNRSQGQPCSRLRPPRHLYGQNVVYGQKRRLLAELIRRALSYRSLARRQSCGTIQRELSALFERESCARSSADQSS